MIVYDVHMVPTELPSYRMKLWLLTAPVYSTDTVRAPVTGHTTSDTTFWRSGAGEAPGVNISGTVTMVEVDATNMPGLYELRFTTTTLSETRRGSCAIRVTNNGGDAFEDVGLRFLLLPRTATGGTF